MSTSTPGFLGLFEFHPPHDAIAITGSNGKRQLRGKVVPQLVDERGSIKGDATEASTALTQAFKLARKDVRDVKRYLELHGAPKAGPAAPKFEAGSKGRVKISWGEKSVEVTSRPCIASQTPFRPSPSATARALPVRGSNGLQCTRNSFGSLPKR